MRLFGIFFLLTAGLHAEKLFNGKNLDNWDIYLKNHGPNKDPDRVFRVENGIVHVSGTEFGYIITKKDYADYYLAAEFKWGTATHAPRKDKARDSGILLHVSGENKIWPRSLEYQYIEGGTGDIWVVGGVGLTVKGVTRQPGESNHRFNRFNKGAWKDEAGYRDPNGDPEKPRGEWNKIELWADGGKLLYKLNGKIVNEASGASDVKGKILFQSEGAEVFFRKIVLKPLRK